MVEPRAIGCGIRSGLLVLTAALVSCVSVPTCPTPAGASGPSEGSAEVVPGEYQLVMTATRGPERGSTVRGILHLAAPDPAIDYRTDILLVGSMEVDLGVVAAPIFPGDSIPADSTDPMEPGVLVIPYIDEDVEVAGPGAVLVVGTSSNLYPVRERIEGDPEGGEIVHMVTDGAGIGLRIERSRSGCFCGRWDRWGIVGSGSGRYCAYHLSDGPSGAGG